jgi:hypothetical protein
MAERRGAEKRLTRCFIYFYLLGDTIVPREMAHKFLDPNHPVGSAPCLLGTRPGFHQVREIRTLSSNAPDLNFPAFSN